MGAEGYYENRIFAKSFQGSFPLDLVLEEKKRHAMETMQSFWKKTQ